MHLTEKQSPQTAFEKKIAQTYALLTKKYSLEGKTLSDFLNTTQDKVRKSIECCLKGQRSDITVIQYFLEALLKENDSEKEHIMPEPAFLKTEGPNVLEKSPQALFFLPGAAMSPSLIQNRHENLQKELSGHQIVSLLAEYSLSEENYIQKISETYYQALMKEENPISLIGYSGGAGLTYVLLQKVLERGAKEKIKNVIMVGSPFETQQCSEFLRLSGVEDFEEIFFLEEGLKTLRDCFDIQYYVGEDDIMTPKGVDTPEEVVIIPKEDHISIFDRKGIEKWSEKL